MTFETIEEAIINRLRADMPYARVVESYAGQLENDVSVMMAGFPAVYVVYNGSDYDWVDAVTHNEAVEFSVIVAAKNLKGNKEARKNDYGCYQMINDVIQSLTNQTFGLEIEKLRPVKVSLVGASKSVSIYGIDYQTNFDRNYENSE